MLNTSKFFTKIKRMINVDFRRMFTTPLVYIMIAVSLVMPILILVMTIMMGGTSTDPITGETVVIETFTNVWQAIGTLSTDNGMNMSITGMCNINMLYFLVAVLVCLFVSSDFKSGYAKNIFAIRPKKLDYIISKTLVACVGGMLMILAFFLGSMLGGSIAGLSFAITGTSVAGIVCCIISKLFLIIVFVPIYLLMSIIGKQRAWLSIIASLCIGMLLFMMIPMLTPLDSTVMNVILCLGGGLLFSVGFGSISNIIFKKVSIL